MEKKVKKEKNEKKKKKNDDSSKIEYNKIQGTFGVSEAPDNIPENEQGRLKIIME